MYRPTVGGRLLRACTDFATRQSFPTVHRVPSQGYIVWEVRSHLREDLRRLPSADIAAMRKTASAGDMFHSGEARHCHCCATPRTRRTHTRKLTRMHRTKFFESVRVRCFVHVSMRMLAVCEV